MDSWAHSSSAQNVSQNVRFVKLCCLNVNIRSVLHCYDKETGESQYTSENDTRCTPGQANYRMNVYVIDNYVLLN